MIVVVGEISYKWPTFTVWIAIKSSSTYYNY